MSYIPPHPRLIGALPEIRTPNICVLSAAPLPIGLVAHGWLVLSAGLEPAASQIPTERSASRTWRAIGATGIESNVHLSAYKANALPVKLRRQTTVMVLTAGLELALAPYESAVLPDELSQRSGRNSPAVILDNQR